MILCQTDLCATVPFALATMSEPIVKIKNVDALKERELNEDGSKTSERRIWPGMITKRTPVEKDGFQYGEWDTEITSKFLEDIVKTIDDDFREIGTFVQFVLDPKDKGGKTAVKAVFNFRWGPRQLTNEAWVRYVHEDWRIGKFPESDYK